MFNSFIRKITKAFTNPNLAYIFLQRRLTNLFLEKEYIGTTSNRSDSDNGTYVKFVQSAVWNYKIFKKFKRHPHYQAILEHVNKEDGQKYFDIIKDDSPKFLDAISKLKENDLVGTPLIYDYPEIGSISPSTLRYIKVSSDLRKFFGDDIGQKIAEIGVGYGGQLLINDKIFDIKEYHLFDLPPVLNLVSKYLECHILNCAYKVLTLNQHVGDFTYDLVISNYAFSELPSQLQLKYIEKVISKSKKGYLTMNSGFENSVFINNKLSLNDLKKLLPSFEIISENPITAPNNYVIVWGHNESKIENKELT
ncbi:putative sugar O-methyltransferase [Methylotenera sp.]|uniref:putative sugar O-methyltransferase n=1 Tax=Methylotenera sp. TaxID=2051956 RepID=UPI00272D2527|nr:putative sugar O-methyltransferase [Methylotenera sp.]